MKKVRSYFQMVLVAMVFMLPVIVSAQGMQHKSAAERAANQTKWMQKNLSLSADQLKQVTDINLKYAQMNEEAMNATGKGEKMKVRKQNQQNKDAELKTVLNADQFQKYQVKEEETKQKMKDRMMDRNNNPGDISNQ
jgi:hypothetical protein